MASVTRTHASQILSGEKNTTLKYDGTTKAKAHWVETQVATTNQTVTIALSKTADGTASSYAHFIDDKLSAIGKY